MMPTRQRHSSSKGQFKGVLAILGMDIVGFSTLSEEEQHEAVAHLFQWIRQSLQYNSIAEDDFIWSHAGDGGYLTFGSYGACTKALDVGFDVVRRVKSGEWKQQNGRVLTLRLAAHAGFVQQTVPLGLGTWKEVSGAGINTTARILSLSAPGQFLASKQYFDGYVKDRKPQDLEVGPMHSRSVKHRVKVEVMNVDRHGLCLNQGDAVALQWEAIDSLWQRMIQDYEALLEDSLKAGSPLTAFAAAAFLLKFQRVEPVFRLCQALGAEQNAQAFTFPVPRHDFLSRIPSATLVNMVALSRTKVFEINSTICSIGAPADTCFFVVSGKAVIDRPDNREPVAVKNGELLGEFSLWISGLRRTATIRACSKLLLVELPKEELRGLLESAAADAPIIEQIKQKIIDHVTSSPELFPDPEARRLETAQCVKLTKGAQLDIEKETYVLFNGAAELNPSTGAIKRIEARGHASADSIVGVFSALGAPDGQVATVVEETVAVRIQRNELKAIQDRSPLVRRAWNSFFGIRLAQLQEN